ncbi:MAG: PH domain-containing protein [bacterium]
MSELDRYLLPSERSVATVRRHWAVLLPQAGALAASWLLWLWVLSKNGSAYVAYVGMFFFLFSFLWFAWFVAEWYREEFALTDKRVLLVGGLFYKRVAVMPLAKVTDLTYERSPLGRMLGYGTFIMESAGQDQALSRIDFIRDPAMLYAQLSNELFGPHRTRRRDLGYTAGYDEDYLPPSTGPVDTARLPDVP